jgi:ubiquinone/menaquinone biosynthesis C-methylase UbiE
MSDGSLIESMQRFYNAIARRTPDLAFVNYGFVDNPDEPSEDLDLIRMCRRLYEAVLEPFPIATGTAVEVGCGRGGGARMLLDRHEALRYVGLDLSAEHLDLSRRRLTPRPFTSFAMADAAALPVADASADVLYSIEAAQHFEHPDRFYREAARVVRPRGWFLLAALWPPSKLPDAPLEAAGFRIDERVDITANVVASLERTSELREKLIDSLDMPERFRPLLLSWAGVRGTPSYDNLATGAMRYVKYRLQR